MHEEQQQQQQQQEGAEGRQRLDSHASETGTSEWEAVSHRSELAPSGGHPTPAPPARGGPAESEHPHPQVT